MLGLIEKVIANHRKKETAAMTLQRLHTVLPQLERQNKEGEKARKHREATQKLLAKYKALIAKLGSKRNSPGKKVISN